MKDLNIYWNAGEFTPEAQALLRAEIGPHKLAVPLPEADVAFGQPNLEQMIGSARLRWVHLTSAGYTNYDRDDVRAALASRGAAMTKSSLVFDEPCAEHLAAFLYAQARQLPQCMTEQLGQRRWPKNALRAESRLLRGQSIVIFGLGSITRRLLELIAPLGMKVTVLRRQVVGDEPVPAAAWDSPQAAAALATADHVLNILPAAPATNNFFTAARFAALKRGATYYNLGRGTTVDQPALIAALESGHLRAAYLDVTTPEPLPPDHVLWRLPNCFLTPHSGGGHADESVRLVRHFLDNLTRFTSGQELLDRVF